MSWRQVNHWVKLYIRFHAGCNGGTFAGSTYSTIPSETRMSFGQSGQKPSRNHETHKQKTELHLNNQDKLMRSDHCRS